MLGFLKLTASVLALCVPMMDAIDPRVAYLEPIVNTEGTYNLGLKALIIAKQTSRTKAARSLLESLDSPYDVVTEVPFLTKPDYNAIIVTDDLAKLDYVKVYSYAEKYKVRIVRLHCKTFTDTGVVTSAQDVKTTNIAFNDAPAMDYYSDVMNTREAWPAEFLTPVGVEVMQSIPASIDRVIPLMRYTTGNTMASAGPLAAFITNHHTGPEIMTFTFDANLVELDEHLNPSDELSNDYTFFNMALANMWFTWATRGVFMGKRRLSLQMHVDDWYLASSSYGENNDVHFRLSGQDVEHVVAWIDSANSVLSLATGSDITFEPAFNGAGISMLEFENNGLVEASKRHAGRFNWISHTWTHQNLDWLENFDCNGETNVCHPDEERYENEFQLNIDVAQDKEVGNPTYPNPWEDFSSSTPSGSLFSNEEERTLRWSRHSLVPPEISGLWPNWMPVPEEFTSFRKPNPKNTLLFEVLKRLKIFAVTGDNTRDELLAANPWHGVYSTNEAYGVEGILIIPRMAPNIDFNINNMEQFEDYYNTAEVCDWVTYGPPCKTGRYTAEEALAREAFATRINFLQYRQDSYMFHQANMAAVDWRGARMPMVAVWAHLALEGLLKYINELPVVSPKMDVTAEEYRRRMGRDLCDLEGYVTIVEGNPSGFIVESRSNKTCQAVVTLVGKEHPLLLLDSESDSKISKEEYGNDTSVMIDLVAGSPSVTVHLLNYNPATEQDIYQTNIVEVVNLEQEGVPIGSDANSHISSEESLRANQVGITVIKHGSEYNGAHVKSTSISLVLAFMVSCTAVLL
eukprot:CFRG5310T1